MCDFGFFPCFICKGDPNGSGFSLPGLFSGHFHVSENWRWVSPKQGVDVLLVFIYFPCFLCFAKAMATTHPHPK
jgi:hypothetical protein